MSTPTSWESEGGEEDIVGGFWGEVFETQSVDCFPRELNDVLDPEDERYLS